MKIKSELEKIGFKENEAKIYFALLELGNSTVLQIAKKAGLPRSSAHDILRSLNRRGFVTTYPKKKRMYFGPSDPDAIRESNKRQARLIEVIMPELQALYNSPKNNSRIRFYEGKDGLKTVFIEICKDTKNIMAISSAQHTSANVAEEQKLFLDLRKKYGVITQTIFRDSSESRKIIRNDRFELRESKIVEDIFPYKGTVLIWKNKLALVSLGESISVLIFENKEMTDLLRAVFSLIWKYVPDIKSV